MANNRVRGRGPRERIDKRTGEKIYVVDYRDDGGKRHQLRYSTQKEANDAWQKIHSELLQGRHVATSQSVALDTAAENYYKVLELEGAARGTIQGHRYAYNKHIKPHLGAIKVPRLTGPMVRRFLIGRREAGVSKNRVKMVKATLSVILSEAVQSGHAAFNAAAAVRVRRTRRAAIAEKEKRRCKVIEKDIVNQLVRIAGQTGWYVMALRHDGYFNGKHSKTVRCAMHQSLEAVEIIQLDNEADAGAIRAALADLRQRWSGEPNMIFRSYYIADWVQPFIVAMAFTGVRIGEMRGLDWMNMDWSGVIEVLQAVDQYQIVGAVKSPAALRKIPTGDIAMQALRRLWERRGRPSSGLIFSGADGGSQSREYIDHHSYAPLWLIMNARDAAGHLVYETFHSLRHFCVSLWIEQGFNPKQVQVWVGHEKIQTTLDTYGHLFKERDDARQKVSGAERAVLGDAFRLSRALKLIKP